MIPNHEHNGTDSQQIDGGDIKNAPQSATTALTGQTASSSYTATEQAMLNRHETVIGELVAKLRDLGFIL